MGTMSVKQTYCFHAPGTLEISRINKTTSIDFGGYQALSRKHAVITVSDSEKEVLTVMDTGSKYGSHLMETDTKDGCGKGLNELEKNTEVQLSHNSVVRFGPHNPNAYTHCLIFRVKYDDNDSYVSESTTSHPFFSKAVHLKSEATKGSERGKEACVEEWSPSKRSARSTRSSVRNKSASESIPASTTKKVIVKGRGKSASATKTNVKPSPRRGRSARSAAINEEDDIPVIAADMVDVDDEEEHPETSIAMQNTESMMAIEEAQEANAEAIDVTGGEDQMMGMTEQKGKAGVGEESGLASHTDDKEAPHVDEWQETSVDDMAVEDVKSVSGGDIVIDAVMPRLIERATAVKAEPVMSASKQVLDKYRNPDVDGWLDVPDDLTRASIARHKEIVNNDQLAYIAKKYEQALDDDGSGKYQGRGISTAPVISASIARSSNGNENEENSSVNRPKQRDGADTRRFRKNYVEYVSTRDRVSCLNLIRSNEEDSIVRQEVLDEPDEVHHAPNDTLFAEEFDIDMGKAKGRKRKAT